MGVEVGGDLKTSCKITIKITATTKYVQQEVKVNADNKESKINESQE